MASILCEHALPAAEFQSRVLGYEVDFAIHQHRLILECDGWDAHGRDPRQFERDREKDAVLAAARVAGPALHLAPHHSAAGLGGIDDPRRPVATAVATRYHARRVAELAQQRHQRDHGGCLAGAAG